MNPTVANPPRRPAGPSSTSDQRRWLVLAVIAVCQLMIVLDSSIVNIALPHAQRSLGISDADRQWVVTAYTLGFGGLLLLGGRIADYLGRKRVLIAGLIGFAVASALGGAAPSAGVLFGARALQGIFAALMAPAALSLLANTFTDRTERAKAFSVYGGISGGGAAIGLVLGGVLTEYANWRWCLLVNTPIALVTAFCAVRLIRDDRGSRGRSYDVRGAVAITVGLVALVYGFTQAGPHGWGSLATLAPLVVGVVLIAAFVVNESRVTAPLLPLRVPLDRNRGGAYLAALLSAMGLFGMFLFLTYYLQGTLHYSALKTGFAFLPFSIGIFVGAGLTSRLLPRVGPRNLLAPGLLLAALGLAWFAQIDVSSSYLVHVVPAELIVSVGMGLAFVTIASTALVDVAPEDSGVASALVNATQQIGGSLGTALLNTIAASATAGFVSAHRGMLAEGLVHGYRVAFWISAAILLVGAATTAVLIRAGRDDLPVGDAVPA
jgi:EmrB/QacA subfamily drug resistance transporter